MGLEVLVTVFEEGKSSRLLEDVLNMTDEHEDREHHSS
jgi:hypothetical protein